MKTRILFVDDEPHILHGLNRMLYGMRDEFDMEFVDSGEKALDLLSRKPFDVIVSDMRMPGMNGADLLARIAELYPETIRFILSGHSDQHLILKSVGTTHQYLNKPCDPDTLKNAIRKATRLRTLLAEESVRRLAGEIKSLPSLPQVYVELMDELRNADPSVQRIGQIIAKDIGMTAKILQLVNSAFFALPRRVTDPVQAVTLLGLEVIKGLMFTVHIFSELKMEKPCGISIEQLWVHSTTVGLVARRLAEAVGCDANTRGDALVAGLLHDAGKLILGVNIPERYAEVTGEARDQGIPLVSAEKKKLGITHAELGGYLLGLWAFPDTIVEGVTYHHSPSSSAGSGISPALIVHIVDGLDNEINWAKDGLGCSNLDLEYIETIGLMRSLPSWRDICLSEIEGVMRQNEHPSAVCR